MRSIPVRCCNCLRHSNNILTGAKFTPKGIRLTFQMCPDCRDALKAVGPRMTLKPQQEAA